MEKVKKNEKSEEKSEKVSEKKSEQMHDFFRTLDLFHIYIHNNCFELEEEEKTE